MSRKTSKMAKVHKEYGKKLKIIQAKQKKLEDMRQKISDEYRKEIERVAKE